MNLQFKTVCQLNHSYTRNSGVVRGLNYQEKPYNQAKVVRVVKGSVYSIGLNIDQGSRFYSQWCGFLLTADSKHLMYLPSNYAHGFITMERDTELEYFTDNIYAKMSAKSVAWNDPDIAIDWTMNGDIVLDTSCMSEKNKAAPLLKETDF